VIRKIFIVPIRLWQSYFPEDEHLQRWLKMAREQIHFRDSRLESAGWLW
jgi:urocanate hydratase